MELKFIKEELAKKSCKKLNKNVIEKNDEIFCFISFSNSFVCSIFLRDI